MVWSVLFQEVVNRGATFGLAKYEEKASQGHLKERLEMAANEMELALERSAKLPITDVSLLQRRKMIKRGYVEAMELINKDKQQVMPAGPELPDAHGVKRKRWSICAKNMSLKPFVALSTDDVRRFEWYADCAGKFVRDVESGCSLHHYTFCNPIVRHLIEGKTLKYYHLEQGKRLQDVYIWPVYSDERGLEAVLSYNYEDSTMAEKCFRLSLFLRLSQSTDIVGVAIKGLQLLTSGFKLAAEFAMGELSMLSNLQDIVHSYGPAWVGIQDWHINWTQFDRPDPACCEGNRHGLCANNNVSSELLPDIFPEQVIFWGFKCYYVPAAEPSRSSCSSFGVVGRSMSTGSGKPPLLLTAAFAPHNAAKTQSGPYALKTIGDDKEYRDDSSIQQVVEAINSDAINCFLHQPDLKNYKIFWGSKHGGALFTLEKMPSRGTSRGSCGTSPGSGAAGRGFELSSIHYFPPRIVLCGTIRRI